MPLESEIQQSKFKHEEVGYCELVIDEFACVFNNLISIRVDQQESQVLMAPNLFKNIDLYKKSWDSQHYCPDKIERFHLSCLGNDL